MTTPPCVKTSLSSPASPQNIWSALSKKEQLSQWYGPPNVQVFVASMDFKESGGTLLNMNMPNGHSMWEKWSYTKIIHLHSIAFDSMLTDEKGLLPIKSEPMPAELSSLITLSHQQNHTQILLESQVKNPTPESLQFFQQNLKAMTQAWDGALQKLNDLAK